MSTYYLNKKNNVVEKLQLPFPFITGAYVNWSTTTGGHLNAIELPFPFITGAYVNPMFFSFKSFLETLEYFFLRG
ncbi:MAG: hypothetical protein AWU58_1835, partial [Methanohalophilus sp. T328-1]